MPTSPKKSPSKRGSAVRDITVKRLGQDDEAFKVHHIREEAKDTASVEPLIESRQVQDDVNDLDDAVEEALANVNIPEMEHQRMDESEPKDVVRVKFSKFVRLVSSRDCSNVVNDNPEEDVIMSSNLLTELAGAHDEREEKKIPLVLLVGIAIGVVLTYILIMK